MRRAERATSHAARLAVREEERSTKAAVREAMRIVAEAAAQHTCAQCSRAFRAGAVSQRFCSHDCKGEWWSDAKSHGPIPLECIVCHEDFESHHANARYCSDRCRRKAGKKAMGEVRRRRAAAKILRMRPAILERFGMRCYLCGIAIERGPEITHPLALTLDHVFPASAGGRDVAENLRPAHRMCNEDKAERLPFGWELVAAGIGPGEGVHRGADPSLAVPRAPSCARPGVAILVTGPAWR